MLCPAAEREPNVSRTYLLVEDFIIGCRRAAELEGAEEANERARALLAEQRSKLAEAREFLQDRQESIAALQAQLATKDAQVGGCHDGSPSDSYGSCELAALLTPRAGQPLSPGVRLQHQPHPP